MPSSTLDSAHPLLKPMGIFESEDPTLDPQAIVHALPPRDRLTPGFISLLLYGTLTVSLIVWPETYSSIRTRGGNTISASRHMDILLEPGPPPPLRPEPQGGGDRGTGTQGSPSPRALDIPKPADQAIIVPEITLPPLATLDPTLPLLATPDPTLPHAASGDGRSKGFGPGSGGGQGGGNGSGSGGGQGGGNGSGGGRTKSLPSGGFDYQIVPIRRTRPYYSLLPGEDATPAIVTVAIVIELDGHVSSAQTIDGPEFLRENAKKFALGYIFEPLARHGFKAPQRTRILFTYSLHDFR